MVLLFATVAKFITSKLISYNAATCSIEVWDRTLWGKESESLTYYTRSNIQAQHRRLEKTVKKMRHS